MLGYLSLPSNPLAGVEYGESSPIQPVVPIVLDQSGRRPQIHNTGLGPTVGGLLTDEPFKLQAVFQNLSDTLTTTLYMLLVVPTWVRIQFWSLVSDQLGSMEIDIWKLPLSSMLAGSVPTVANTICPSSRPSLVNQYANQSASVSAWNQILEPNDVLGMVVLDTTSISQATFSLQGQRLKLQ